MRAAVLATISVLAAAHVASPLTGWWEPVGGPGGAAVVAVAASAARPDRIWIGTSLRGVWRSTDGGAHWARRDAGMYRGSTVNALAIDPRDPDVLYAAGPGLWKTTDGGASWQLQPLGPGF